MIDRSADPAAIDRPDPQQTPPADAPHVDVLPIAPSGEDSVLYVHGLGSLHNQKESTPPPPTPWGDAAFSAQTSRGVDALRGGLRSDIYLVLTSVYAEATHARARAR